MNDWKVVDGTRTPQCPQGAVVEQVLPLRWGGDYAAIWRLDTTFMGKTRTRYFVEWYQNIRWWAEVVPVTR